MKNIVYISISYNYKYIHYPAILYNNPAESFHNRIFINQILKIGTF